MPFILKYIRAFRICACRNICLLQSLRKSIKKQGYFWFRMLRKTKHLKLYSKVRFLKIYSIYIISTPRGKSQIQEAGGLIPGERWFLLLMEEMLPSPTTIFSALSAKKADQ